MTLINIADGTECRAAGEVKKSIRAGGWPWDATEGEGGGEGVRVYEGKRETRIQRVGVIGSGARRAEGGLSFYHLSLLTRFS